MSFIIPVIQNIPFEIVDYIDNSTNRKSTAAALTIAKAVIPGTVVPALSAWIWTSLTSAPKVDTYKCFIIMNLAFQASGLLSAACYKAGLSARNVVILDWTMKTLMGVAAGIAVKRLGIYGTTLSIFTCVAGLMQGSGTYDYAKRYGHLSHSSLNIEDTQ